MSTGYKGVPLHLTLWLGVFLHQVLWLGCCCICCCGIDAMLMHSGEVGGVMCVQNITPMCAHSLYCFHFMEFLGPQTERGFFGPDPTVPAPIGDFKSPHTERHSPELTM